MSPRGHRRSHTLAALLILAQATMGAGADQQREARPDQCSATHYYAVVGAVPEPATYASQLAEVPLRDVVRRAGGMTAGASGGIRVIHSGRERLFAPSGQLPDESVRVLAGSIIVVESRSATTGPEASDFVHIACENLLERPVVLGGHARLMTLSRVLDALGQSRLRSTDSIQVLPRTLHLGNATWIPSGTVLHFDPATIDRDALQRVFQASQLTDVLPLDEQEVLWGNVVPVVAEVTPHDGVVPMIAPDPPAEPSGSPPIAAVSGGRDNPAPVPIVEQAQQVSPATGSVDPELATSTDDLESSSIRLLAAESKDTWPDTHQKLDPRGIDRAGPAVANRSGEPPVLGNRPQPRFYSQIAYAAAAAGGLALLAMLGAILWSRRERRQLRVQRQEQSESRSTGTGIHPAPTQRHALDLLINDELPVVVEEVVFPEGTEFHGRAVGFRYLLRHEPQALRGPHFQATVQTGNETGSDSGLASAVRHDEGRQTASGRSGHRRKPAAPGTVSPLERALRVRQRGNAP